MLFEHLPHCCDLSFLLTDGNVDAGHILALLIDDRVNGDSGLACLSVTNDQFALTTTNRDHRVDGDQPGLDGRINVLTLDNAGSDALNVVILGGLNWASAVDGFTEGVYHAAQNVGADGYGSDTARCADFIAFIDSGIFAQNNDTNVVNFEVERDTERSVGEL